MDLLLANDTDHIRVLMVIVRFTQTKQKGDRNKSQIQTLNSEKNQVEMLKVLKFKGCLLVISL